MSIGGECRPLSQPTQRVNTRTFFLLVSYRPRMSRPTGSWSWSIHRTYAAAPIYESVIIELTRYFTSHPRGSGPDPSRDGTHRL